MEGAQHEIRVTLKNIAVTKHNNESIGYIQRSLVILGGI